MESNNTIDMIKLKNPYAEYKEYNCFGCSPTNPSGLKMEFHEDGDAYCKQMEHQDMIIRDFMIFFMGAFRPP